MAAVSNNQLVSALRQALVYGMAWCACNINTLAHQHIINLNSALQLPLLDTTHSSRYNHIRSSLFSPSLTSHHSSITLTWLFISIIFSTYLTTYSFCIYLSIIDHIAFLGQPRCFLYSHSTHNITSLTYHIILYTLLCSPKYTN